MPNAKKSKQAARRDRVAAMRAQQKRAERRRNLITIGAIVAVAAVIIGGVAWYAIGRSNGSSSGATAQVIPPGVTGQTTVQIRVFCSCPRRPLCRCRHPVGTTPRTRKASS